jgi:hypothetical protein
MKMKSLTPEQLKKKLMESYNKHPPGWKIVYTIGKDGRCDTGVVNPIVGVQYWLCQASPFSSREVGFEGTIGDDFPFKDNGNYDMDFGVRYADATSEEKESFLKSGRMPASVKERLIKIRGKKPEPFDEDKTISKPHVLNMCKRVITGMKLSDICPSQAEFEAKIQEELKRLEREHLGYIQ